MPIVRFTTDYTGRKKDINIYPSLNPALSTEQKTVPAFGRVSSYCGGVQKLVQRYSITLLTVRGSQPSYPLFGTDLLKQVNVGSLLTLGDLTHAFNFASASAVEQIKGSQLLESTIPLDEQLDTAMLFGITFVTKTEVKYQVTLYTKAGLNYAFLLPIPIIK